MTNHVITTAVGTAIVKLGGKQAEFVEAEHNDPGGFTYRNRRYIGKIMIKNSPPDYPVLATDYSFMLKRAGSDVGAGSKICQAIGNVIVAALREFLKDHPEALEAAEHAATVDEIESLSKQIAVVEQGLTAMRQKRRELAELAWPGRTSAMLVKDTGQKTTRVVAAEIADCLSEIAEDTESLIADVSLGRTANITLYTASGQHFWFDVKEVDES